MNVIKNGLKSYFCLVFLLAVFQVNAQETNPEQEDLPTVKSIEGILKSYVDDFKQDRFAADERMFGIRVPDHGEWHVHVLGKKDANGWQVTLNRGSPVVPTYIYKVDAKTLARIDAGKLNALTAQGKAFADDNTPMSVVYMDGYEPSLEEVGKLNPFSFHFWTRGFPETIPFRDNLTRKGHGSNFGIFYYQPGLRSGWYSVKPGEKVHDGPREKAMPFPMLAIATKGTTEGEIDGKRISLSEGHAVFIPPNAEHRWWNASEQTSEAIVIMFGNGA